MATPEELLQSMDQRRLAALLPEDRGMLDQLVASGMTKGLGIGERGIGFSGPVAGYEGPLRPEDAPSFAAGADIPVYYGSPKGIMLSPGTVQAREDAGGPFRGLMPQEKAEQLSQGLQGQDPNIVKGVLQSLGINENPYTKAFATEKGKLAARASAGMIGEGAIPTDLRESLGTSKFADTMVKYAGKMSFDDQMKLEKLHDARSKALTPDKKMAYQYENATSSVKRLDRLQDKYDAAVPQGSLSQNLKLAIAQASTPAAIMEGLKIPYLDKLTDAEVQFVAEANSILSGMRQMYDDTRMSDQDVKNFLRALGSPVTGKRLFTAQLKATRQVMEDRANAVLNAMKGSGQDVTRLVGYEAPGKTAQAKAPQAAIDYLKANPGSAEQFKAKYGYLP